MEDMEEATEVDTADIQADMAVVSTQNIVIKAYQSVH